jgi:hypothetical protein
MDPAQHLAGTRPGPSEPPEVCRVDPDTRLKARIAVRLALDVPRPVTRRLCSADLRQMQATAASYLDDGYRHNQVILETAAKRVGRAITLLTVEILALVVALVVTLVS